MDEIVKKAKDFADKYYNKLTDSEYKKKHVMLVRKYALKLAKIEGGDKQVVEIAALLHDIGVFAGRLNHHKKSAELAKLFLKRVKLPKEKKELIIKCILKHRTRFSKEKDEIEIKIIQNADSLGTLFNNEFQDQSRKELPKKELLRLYNKHKRKLTLKSAQSIGLSRIELLKKLI